MKQAHPTFKSSSFKLLLPASKLPDLTGVFPGLTYIKRDTTGLQDTYISALRSGIPRG